MVALPVATETECTSVRCAALSERTERSAGLPNDSVLMLIIIINEEEKLTLTKYNQEKHKLSSY